MPYKEKHTCVTNFSYLPGRDESGTLCIHIGCTMGGGILAKIERGTLLTCVEFSVTKSLYTLPLNAPNLIWLGMIITQRTGVESNGVPP